MTTLREAAQNVVEVWKLYGTTESLRGWMEILEAALAEPVQEPVAWVECDGDLVWNNREAAIGRNLYTSPPQRKPLLAVDLRALYDQHAACQEEGPETSGWWDFARAIERAHGIT